MIQPADKHAVGVMFFNLVVNLFQSVWDYDTARERVCKYVCSGDEM